MSGLLTLLPLLVSYADKTPRPNDVKAGWGALLVFVLLGLAVAFLGWALTRQLKRTQRNADAGAFGEEDVRRAGPSEPAGPAGGATGPAGDVEDGSPHADHPEGHPHSQG